MIDPDKVPSRYPHELWMSTVSASSNHKLKAHNDRECPELRKLQGIRKINKNDYVYEINMCQRCEDQATDRTGETQTSLAAKLKSSDNPGEVLKNY